MRRHKRAASRSERHGGRQRSAAGCQTLQSNFITGAPGRQVPAHGVVHGTLWTKRVSKVAGHFFWRHRAWCVDEADLEAAERLGIEVLRWLEQDSGNIYETTPQMFRLHGIPMDEGHGAQIALPERFWSVNGRPPEVNRPEPENDTPVQLPLFGGRP